MSGMTHTCWNIVKKSFGDARGDLRRISKQSWILGVLSFFGFAALLLALILPSVLNPVYGDGGYGTACILDGDFSLFPSVDSFWSVTGFFNISLSFGKLTFGQAKIIDIIWDLVSHTRITQPSVYLCQLTFREGLRSRWASCLGLLKLAVIYSLYDHDYGARVGTYRCVKNSKLET